MCVDWCATIFIYEKQAAGGQREAERVRRVMGNVFRVLKRDVLRLLKTPAALVVIFALLVLPSAYTWYNVVAFWNPYENTGHLRVCVVNQDEGASSELTGEMHVGDMIVEKLQENDQLDWVFTNYDDAHAQVEAGESYAFFVIPPDFTERLLTLTTGHFQSPEISYYVNEKAGPVAPKITDTGASTLDRTINSTFVSTVSDVASEALDKFLDESAAHVEDSKAETNTKITTVIASLDEAHSALGEIASGSDKALEKTAEARQSLAEARTAAQDAAESLKSVASVASQLQQQVQLFSGKAMPLVSQAITSAGKASADTNAAMADASEALGNVRGSLSEVMARANQVNEENKALLENLRGQLEALPEDSPLREPLQQVVSQLEERVADAQQLLESLQQAQDDAGQTTEAIGTAVSQLDQAAQSATATTSDLSNSLFGTTLPGLSGDLSSLAQAAATLSATVGSQTSLVDETVLLLDQLDATIGSFKDAIGQTDELLVDLRDSLSSARDDVSAILNSNIIVKLFGEDGVDAAQIADFMESPTQLKTEELYPLNAYGSAMAPLFLNLTFWIGAFMLMVVLKQEVDGEGIKNLTLAQRYLGRFLLLAIMVTFQAVICIAGILVIGVETVSAPALFFAAVVTALAYLSIIYALSVTLQHIGKGICVILVFAQIPGGTGIYPVEMTSAFFQAVYPFLPFTYGINAMREAICGFYGNQYLEMLGMLVLFFALFMALGLLVRPYLANVNRMVARQVREGGIFNGENVTIPGRRYRMSQLVRALAARDEYREELEHRIERFKRWYPKLIRGSIVLGVVVPVVLAVVFAVTPLEKVVLLTLWLVWVCLEFVFLVVLESLRYSLDRQLRLDSMSEESIMNLYAHRHAMEEEGMSAEAAAAATPVAATAAAGAGAVAPSAPPTPGEPDAGEVHHG